MTFLQPTDPDALEHRLNAGLDSIRMELSTQLARELAALQEEIRKDLPTARAGDYGAHVRGGAAGTAATAPARTPFDLVVKQALAGRNVLYLLSILSAIFLAGGLVGRFLVPSSPTSTQPPSRSDVRRDSSTAGLGSGSQGQAAPDPRVEVMNAAIQKIRNAEEAWRVQYENHSLERSLLKLKGIAGAQVTEAIDRYTRGVSPSEDEIRIVVAVVQSALNTRASFRPLAVDGVVPWNSLALVGATGQELERYLNESYLPELGLTRDAGVAPLDLLRRTPAATGPELLPTLARAVALDHIGGLAR